MLRIISFSLFVFGLLIQTTSAQSLDEQALRIYIEEARQAWQIPGMAVGIVKGDKLIFAEGFGVREEGKPEKVDAETVFAIASNTKAFTAAALGLLVDAGQISWEDRIQDYMPEFQLYDAEAAQKATIRDMLCHRIGFPTWGGDFTWYGSQYDRRETIRRMRYQPPQFDFRTDYGYCNLGFLVAGELIPTLTGQSWDDFVIERLTKPLGMSRSSTRWGALGRLDNVATPHTIWRGTRLTVPYRNVDNIGPAASMNSSVNDLSKWVIHHLNPPAAGTPASLHAGIIEEMRTSNTLRRVSPAARARTPEITYMTYGLGFFVMDYHGNRLIQHSGGMDGMLSRVAMLPDEQLGVIILTNYDDHYLISCLHYYIFDRLLGKPEKDWSAEYLALFRNNQASHMANEMREQAVRQADAPPRLPLAALAGEYESPLYGPATLTAKDGALHLELGAHPDICERIEHWQQDEFVIHWSDKVLDKSRMYLEYDDNGRVEAFHFQIRPDFIDPLVYRFERK